MFQLVKAINFLIVFNPNKLLRVALKHNHYLIFIVISDYFNTC
jgi:hypothetical protein